MGAALAPLTITSCTLDAGSPADSSGVTTPIAVTADDGQGGTLSVTQQQTAGATGVTITETATYTRGDQATLAVRFAIAGTWHDARDPSAAGPLLQVTNRTVRGAGLFGPAGAVAGNPDLVAGELVLSCG